MAGDYQTYPSLYEASAALVQVGPFLFPISVFMLSAERLTSGGRNNTGPPMAPRITASAFLAAVRASSVNGERVASIEAFAFVRYGLKQRSFQ